MDNERGIMNAGKKEEFSLHFLSRVGARRCTHLLGEKINFAG